MNYPLVETSQYIPRSLVLMIEAETDAEFNPELRQIDMDMDDDAKALRDWEICLDMTGNLDSELL